MYELLELIVCMNVLFLPSHSAGFTFDLKLILVVSVTNQQRHRREHCFAEVKDLYFFGV